MYYYQLMLAKTWQQQDEKLHRPLSKRIKHFYNDDYDDIVKQLVAEPDSCKDFYDVLQQVGLPYQSSYHKPKSAEIVSQTLKTALFTEQVILVIRPSIGWDYVPSLYEPGKKLNASMADFKPEPMYQSDDSWLIVDLVNHKPEPISFVNDTKCFASMLNIM